VWAEVDLAAIGHNVRVLGRRAGSAQVCAVVKAGGYGHGAVETARAAVDGGASWLAVALVEEGAELRDAGVEAPVLLLSEPPVEAMADVVGLRLTPTVYTPEGVAAAAAAVAAAGGATPLAVHVKVDTGMHRVGASPADAVKLALTVDERPELSLQGVWTHFAVADDPDDPFTGVQHDRLVATLDELAGLGVRPALAHACNSAGLLAHPDARHDLVRCGLAVYGVAPSLALEGQAAELRPALSLKARVSLVREVEAGEGVSYGLRFRAERTTVVATVPIGYADGVPWRLPQVGAEVLIGGRRRPLAGAVTMDQLMVDCGDDRSVRVGDEVVLIGRQGADAVGAWEWAGRLGTIAYEVLTGIGARVPRVHR